MVIILIYFLKANRSIVIILLLVKLKALKVHVQCAYHIFIPAHHWKSSTSVPDHLPFFLGLKTMDVNGKCIIGFY